MNRSHHDIVKRSAACCVAMLLLSGGAAYASNGEHTDWPDYPDGERLSGRVPARPLLPIRVIVRDRDAKHRPGDGLDKIHTDWPDYPDGDPSSIFDSLEIPNDPSIMPISPIPGLDQITSPFAPMPGFGGFGADSSPDLGLTTVAPVPAPGGVLIMMGLAAAATRRRR